MNNDHTVDLFQFEEQKTKPDVVLFRGQTADQVLDMLKEKNIEPEPPDMVDFISACTNRKNKEEVKNLIQKSGELKIENNESIFEDTNECACDIEIRKTRAKIDTFIDKDCALWRKLANVEPDAPIQTDETDLVVNTVFEQLKQKFPKLIFGWAEDYIYDRPLTINAAKTFINKSLIISTIETLNKLTDKDNSIKIVIDILQNKIQGLFI